MREQSDMAVSDRIKAKLQAALTPDFVEIIDESHKHAGHAHAVATVQSLFVRIPG